MKYTTTISVLFGCSALASVLPPRKVPDHLLDSSPIPFRTRGLHSPLCNGPACYADAGVMGSVETGLPVFKPQKREDADDDDDVPSLYPCRVEGDGAPSVRTLPLCPDYEASKATMHNKRHHPHPPKTNWDEWDMAACHTYTGPCPPDYQNWGKKGSDTSIESIKSTEKPAGTITVTSTLTGSHSDSTEAPDLNKRGGLKPVTSKTLPPFEMTVVEPKPHASSSNATATSTHAPKSSMAEQASVVTVTIPEAAYTKATTTHPKRAVTVTIPEAAYTPIPIAAKLNSTTLSTLPRRAVTVTIPEAAYKANPTAVAVPASVTASALSTLETSTGALANTIETTPSEVVRQELPAATGKNGKKCKHFNHWWPGGPCRQRGCC